MQLWRQVSDRKGRRVLDVSCASGTSTRALIAEGMNVTCTNYGTERHPGIPEEAEFVGGVDLNARIRRLLLSRHALLSRNLLVRAEKTGAEPFDA